MATAKYDWERDLLRRWYDGIKLIPTDNKKFNVDFSYEEGPEKKVDVAIVYGGVRPANTKGVQEVRKSIVEGSRLTIINETPLLGRTISKCFNWHRVGINSHLYGSGDFNAKNMDDSRLIKYKEEWKIKAKPWNKTGKNIVLALQLPGDSSLRKQDMSEWAVNVLEKLLKTTDKNIRVRTHPAFNDNDHCQLIELYKYVARLGSDRIKFSYGNAVPWDDDLEDCYCVIAYSSGLSIDAIDNGIPVIAMDQANFAYDISSHYIEDINDLKFADNKEKAAWYNEMSFSQWSTQEIQEGTVWMHLLPAIQQKLLEE